MPTSPTARLLTPDELAEVADLRAHGSSWDVTASAVGWDADALRRTVRFDPEYLRLYEEAERGVERESVAEMLFTYRAQLRHPDVGTARKAADAIAKHNAGERRDRVRLAIEQFRADAARAKAEAKKSKAEPPALGAPATELPPEAVHQPNLEDLYARRAVDTHAIVWLWGGAHKIGGVEPDPASDVPLALFGDDTLAGRKVFWAARFPLCTDPFNGPFPAPQEPVPVLTPEQARQLNPCREAEDSVEPPTDTL